MIPHPPATGRATPTRGALLRFVVGVLASVVLSAGVMTLVLASLPAALPGWTVTAVSSGSMTPALQVGDAVAVVEWPPDRPMLDAPSVILVDRGNAVPVLHRIVDTDGTTYRTKGDANAEPDTDRVRPEQVIGVGRLAVRGGGWLSLWVAERNLGALALVALTVGALLRLARFGWLERYDPWLPRTGADRDARDPDADPSGDVGEANSAPDPAPQIDEDTVRGGTSGTTERLAGAGPANAANASASADTSARRPWWGRRITSVIVMLTVGTTAVGASSSGFTARTVYSGTVAATTISPPSDLLVTCTSVLLPGTTIFSWSPSTSSKVTGYQVFRDSTLVATVSAATTSWSTTKPPSSTGTVFEVATVAGGWSSSRARMTVAKGNC